MLARLTGVTTTEISVAVRAVRAADAAALRDARLRALADVPAAFSSTAAEEAALPPSHWAELAHQSEIADHVAIYAAIDGDRWLGLAAGRWHDRERGVAQLWSMWVAPEARRQGLGERLILGVRGWAAGHGAVFLRLGVITRPDDATPFYERLGFVRTGEVRPLRTDPSRSAHFLARPV